jgi:excisionase family DNA binding protein
MKIQDNKWLTKKDLCQYLKVSLRTVENWTSQGIIKAYKLGGRVLFNREEIDTIIQSNTI